MRLREWFSWHFPELGKIVSDNFIFTKLVYLIEKRDNLTDDLKDEMVEILKDEEKAQQILEANKVSMGQDMSEADVL